MVGPFNEYYQHQQQQYPYYDNNNNNYNYNYNNNGGAGLCYDDDETDYMYSSSSSTSSYSSSVDCTLSLGTPSTRLTNNQNSAKTTTTTTPHRNSVSSFCWDLLHPNKHSNSKSSSSRGGGNNNHSSAGGNAADPLFVRRCANCDTTSTPLWRNGPRGPKSLCNACGIRFKKEERRAAAASTTTANNNVSTNGVMDDTHHVHGYYNGSWGQQYNQTTPQKIQCYGPPNEFMFMDDEHTSSETGIQFLSWLTHDRPTGLVHHFTR